ncbi:methyltransferase domain-containing protein [Streptomyces sp. NPDC048290]|uniref:methyltransferase domain-containing protein n=1 Tax=Streptomyces sp. NPDC048290 TaxID=3155811 RepID=UPI003438125A
MHTPLVARCVRGLESALAAEVLRSPGTAVTGLGHREVRLLTTGSVPAPRTADDVFLHAARCPDIGRARAGLPALTGLVTATDPGAPLALRRTATGSPAPTGIDVSASFLGHRAFNRYDIEDTVGEALSRHLGLPYHSRRTGVPAPPDHWGWRVTLDGTHAALMLRGGGRPLHRRDYRRITVPGALHPPVAAAMAALADPAPGALVLDPCCGAGTLLAESALREPAARHLGFDLSGRALTAARANTEGLPVTVERADAARLPLADGTVDRVLCNPPWGGQVPALGGLAGAPERWWRELRRVLAPDGTAVLLLPGAGELTGALAAGLVPAHVQRIRVSGAEAFMVRLDPVRRPSARPSRASGRSRPRR